MSKMIQCKVCNEEIAANAKVCPKCGAKNKKPLYMRWWVWIIAVIVVAAMASGSGGDTKKTGDSDKSDVQSEVTEYAIGDTVETEKFEIKITNVKTCDSVGNQYISTTPSEGGVYVVVEWECKNISKKPVSSFSCPTISLEDGEGVSYDSDIDATSHYATEAELDRKILSDLNPGINVKDAQVFEIAKEAYEKGGFSVKVSADSDFNVEIN